MALRILRDAAETEIVVVETFLEIWHEAGKYDSKMGSALSWAAMLSRNKALDRIRSSQGGRVFKNSMTKQNEPANSVIYGREKAAMIQSILAGLPLEDSRAIELAYFGGLAEQRSRGLQELPDALKGCIRRGLLTLRFQLDRLED
jgi:RNA polymerase sigma-70 factor (ECF subfamily)